MLKFVKLMEEEQKKSLLIVEGKSEERILPLLCRKSNIDVSFEIISENSIEQLKQAIPIHLKSTNIYHKLWIIADADNNADNVWKAIKNLLLKSGKYTFDFNMPLPAVGAVIAPNDPEDITVGIWIMPNNSDIGMLEDFMLNIIPQDDSLIKNAKQIIATLDAERDKHTNLFRPTHKSKACIHTWLAWHHKPGESLTVAVEKRFFDTDSQLCKDFTNWLRQLN